MDIQALYHRESYEDTKIIKKFLILQAQIERRILSRNNVILECMSFLLHNFFSISET
jgi:hypothetical protein